MAFYQLTCPSHRAYLHVDVIGNQCTEYEVYGVKRFQVLVISCTSSGDTDIPTDISTNMCKAICPSFFEKVRGA